MKCIQNMNSTSAFSLTILHPMVFACILPRYKYYTGVNESCVNLIGELQFIIQMVIYLISITRKKQNLLQFLSVLVWILIVVHQMFGLICNLIFLWVMRTRSVYKVWLHIDDIGFTWYHSRFFRPPRKIGVHSSADARTAFDQPIQ